MFTLMEIWDNCKLDSQPHPTMQSPMSFARGCFASGHPAALCIRFFFHARTLFSTFSALSFSTHSFSDTALTRP